MPKLETDSSNRESNKTNLEKYKMNSKLIPVVALIAVVAVAAIAIVAVNGGNDNGSSDKPFEAFTVEDLAGNKVTISKEIKRVAITDVSTLELFATAYGEGWDKVVCMMPADISSRDMSLGSYIEKTWPELSKLPKCPDMFSGFSTNPLSVSEAIIDANPDFVLLAKSYIDYFPGALDGFFNMLKKADIPYFETMFYTWGLSEGIADKNFTPLGKILQKEDRAKDMVKFYDEKLKIVKDRVSGRSGDTIRFYGEVPVKPSTYGTVSAYGFPEIDILGYNIQNDYGGGYNFSFNLEKMIECQADWIVIISTAYYGDKQLTGYFVQKDEKSLQSAMDEYLSRDGWSELDAVKNKHVCFRYGEMRNGLAGLYDLYDLANIVDEKIVSDKELADLTAGLNKFMPWKIDGTFSYVTQ